MDAKLQKLLEERKQLCNSFLAFLDKEGPGEYALTFVRGNTWKAEFYWDSDDKLWIITADWLRGIYTYNGTNWSGVKYMTKFWDDLVSAEKIVKEDILR